VVGRFYKLILVDTGNNVRAENWQAAVDATDQLVITMSARNDSAETAARLLDHLEQTGRRELIRRAVTIVTMPPHRKEVDPQAIERHSTSAAASCCGCHIDRTAPDSGGPVRYPLCRRRAAGFASGSAA
jgi:MinD-like ATPase involved in chromosome partitioning or flagellar assembly